MSTDTPQVAAARIKAERERAQLMETARQLQERISPAVLAHNAWQGAKTKGADLAEDAVDAVRSRPAIVGGIAAAIGLFLAREPLMDAAGKLKRKVKSEGPKAPRKIKVKAVKPAKAPRPPRVPTVNSPPADIKLTDTETIE
jgi:ElaB/YqjD/DUF883 family membrane-anchored ribosome-binding protein